MKVASVVLLLVLVAFSGFGQGGVSFSRADSVASLYPKYPLANLELLSNLLTHSLEGDIEKFRSIFVWVTSNISNDYSLYKENATRRKRWRDNPEKLSVWKRKYRKKVFERLNTSYQTMCTGYAYLMKELCEHADLECVLVNGYGRTMDSNVEKRSDVNHSWNAVKLEGRWWLTDATWSSGYIRSDNKQFVSTHDDSYFLVPPELFWRSHFPEDPQWLLMENAPGTSEFLHSPLLYRGAYEVGIVPVAPATFHYEARKNIPIRFRLQHFGSSEVNFKVKVTNFGENYSYVPALRALNEYIAFDYTFTRKGLYDVQLYANEKLVASYQVSVR